MTPESYARVLTAIAPTAASDPLNIAKCGTCGFTWDDSVPTDLTPAPAARCPNEYNHTAVDEYDDETVPSGPLSYLNADLAVLVNHDTVREQTGEDA